MFLAFRPARYLHAADWIGNVQWIMCVFHIILKMESGSFPEGLAQMNHGNLAIVLYFAKVCVFNVPNNLKELDCSHQRKT